MYQLTITFESGQQMADTIADLVNNHRELRLSVHLDEMISPDHSEYVLTAEDRALRADLERHLVSEQKPAHMRKADKLAKDAKTEFVRVARLAIENYDCPACGRERFRPCVSSSGSNLGGKFAHRARRDLAIYGEAF